SISAGLDASTVTPGMTAPVVSLTTPAIATCAWLVRGSRNTAAHKRAVQSTTRRIQISSAWTGGVRGLDLTGARAACQGRKWPVRRRGDPSVHEPGHERRKVRIFVHLSGEPAVRRLLRGRVPARTKD